MELLISKWVRETENEYQKAKSQMNLYKMNEMQELKKGLLFLRDKLSKLKNL
jgi:hypothetical protein